MIEFDYVISHPVGLYAALADGLVAIANRYESEIYILYQEKKVSMKSLMGVISLGVPCNGRIHITITGEDKNEVKQSLDTFLKDMLSFFYSNTKKKQRLPKGKYHDITISREYS